MERPLVSQIYAYIVCLLAIVIGFASLAGFISSAFRTAHPTMGPGLMVRHMGPGHFGGGRYGGGMRTMPLPGPGGPATGGATGPIAQMRANFIADARYNAVRGLVTHLIILIAAILLFNWHWRWLHGTRPSVT